MKSFERLGLALAASALLAGTPETAHAQAESNPTVKLIAERAIYAASLDDASGSVAGSTYIFDIPYNKSTAHITVPGLVDGRRGQLNASLAKGIDISVYAPGTSEAQILDIPLRQNHLFIQEGTWSAYEASAYGRKRSRKHVMEVTKNDSISQYDESLDSNGANYNNLVLIDSNIIATYQFNQIKIDTLHLMNNIILKQQ